MSTSTPRGSSRLAISSPRWSVNGKRVSITYELPSRVYAAKIYPLRAPNGSSVVLYGHENGLACFWRGGSLPRIAAKIIREPTLADPNTKAAGEDVIMIDDDDDDDNNNNNSQQDGKRAPQPHVSSSQVDVGAQENEADVLNPFDDFVDSLDVPLDTAVIDIALCPLPNKDSRDLDIDGPAVLSKEMVIAIACADSSIHLITIPLTPPAFAQAHLDRPSAGSYGFRDMLIVGPNASSRAVSRGLSLTWTTSERLVSESSDDTKHRPSGPGLLEWNFLLAYHFASRSGVLKIFKIPLDGVGDYVQAENPDLLRHEHLAGIAKSISFNPAPFPSWRHTQLLLSDSQGAVHIYQSAMPAFHPSRADDLSSTSFGSPWLLSLRTPFGQDPMLIQQTGNVEERIDVLDAQWACSGKCIVALLADGQWGIWDIGGVGPGRQSSLLRGSSGFSGQRISGSGIARFALRGYVGGVQPTGFSKATLGTVKHAESTKLVPMTPNTRKTKQDSLFGSTKQTVSPPPGHSTGGISLCNVASETFDTDLDDSLLIWFNSEIYSLPSLWSYWQHVARTAAAEGNQQRDGSNTDTLFGPNLAQLKGLSAGGEMITSVSQTQSQRATVLRSRQSMTSDILASAEHRIIISCPTKSLRAPTSSIGSVFHLPNSQLEQLPGNRAVKPINQDMLVRRELGLHAVDKILDNMDRNVKSGSRRVEFSVDY